MPTVVGVSFRETGKTYYFDPGALELNLGEYVIAETARGLEMGILKQERREVPEAEIVPPLRPVVRQATDEDRKRDQDNRVREQEALEVCTAKVTKHNLPMKLLRAEYTFDRSRVIFFFFAEGRVDFRELVKDLASVLRTRIELRQVGSRDAAKLLGGFGRCGREVCCGWLSNFQPISIKMAKEQDLALNPTKFSGLCGKLMCCLRFEADHYRKCKANLPKVGVLVDTPEGQARVVEVNVPAEMVRVEYNESGQRAEVPSSTLRVVPEAQEEAASPVETPDAPQSEAEE